MSIEPIDDALASNAEPAAERIEVALCDAISKVAVPNGYWTDVRVTRPEPGEPEPVQHAVVEVVLDNEAKADPETVPLGIEQIEATFGLCCDVVSPASKPVKISTLIHRIKADVKRAVMRDRTLGGLAMDLRFGDAEILATDEASHTGRIILLCIVTYRTLEADPYELLTNPA